MQVGLQWGGAGASARLMIDTGASVTCIDEGLIQSMGAIPIRTRSIIGVNGTPQMRPVYRMKLLIGMGVQRVDAGQVPPPSAAGNGFFGIDFDVTGVQSLGSVQGLIGRDLLASCRFVYDGPSSMFLLFDRTDELRHALAGDPPRSPDDTFAARERERKLNGKKLIPIGKKSRR